MYCICDNCKKPSKETGRLTKINVLMHKNKNKFGTYNLIFRTKRLCKECLNELNEKSKVIFDKV